MLISHHYFHEDIFNQKSKKRTHKHKRQLFLSMEVVVDGFTYLFKSGRFMFEKECKKSMYAEKEISMIYKTGKNLEETCFRAEFP